MKYRDVFYLVFLSACATENSQLENAGSAAKLNDFNQPFETVNGLKKIAYDPSQETDLATILTKQDISPDTKQAILAMQNGEYQEAAKFFNTALLSHPGDSYLHFLNALNYLKLAQQGQANAKELAITGFLYAITYDNTNILAHNRLGYIYFQSKDYEKAQRHFAAVLLLKDPDVKSLYALAAASYYAHDLKTSYASITQAATLEPNNAIVLRAACMIAAALNQPLEVQQFRKRYEEVVKKSDAKLDSRLRNWMSAYNSPGLILTSAASDDTGSDDSQGGGDDASADAPIGDDASGGDPQAADTNTADPNNPNPLPITDPSVPLSSPPTPIAHKLGKIDPNNPDTFVIDCAIMRVSEEGKTNKGSNILDTIAVAFNPGQFTKTRTYTKGANAAGNSFNTTITQSVAFSPLNNSAGTAIQYSLNIFNVTDNRVEIVSRPTLLAALGKTSEFFAGTDLVAGVAGSFNSSLEKIPVGYRVTVTPIGSRKDRNGVLKVQFDVRVEGNSIGLLAANVQNNFSQINHSFVNTTVEMAFGETVILAGIFDREDNSSKSYTPVLGQIPGLHLLFSNETTDSVRKSVVYMMTLRRSESQENDANSMVDDKRLSPEVKELQLRNLTWFHTIPNSALIMKGLSRVYREFRVGDIPNLYWQHEDSGQQNLEENNEISEAVKMLES